MKFLKQTLDFSSYIPLKLSLEFSAGREIQLSPTEDTKTYTWPLKEGGDLQITA